MLHVNPQLSLLGVLVTALLMHVLHLFRQTLSFFYLAGPGYASRFFFYIKNVCCFSSHNARNYYRERGDIQKYPKELPDTWERETVEYGMNNLLQI